MKLVILAIVILIASIICLAPSRGKASIADTSIVDNKVTSDVLVSATPSVWTARTIFLLTELVSNSRLQIVGRGGLAATAQSQCIWGYLLTCSGGV